MLAIDIDLMINNGLTGTSRSAITRGIRMRVARTIAITSGPMHTPDIIPRSTRLARAGTTMKGATGRLPVIAVATARIAVTFMARTTMSPYATTMTITTRAIAITARTRTRV